MKQNAMILPLKYVSVNAMGSTIQKSTLSAPRRVLALQGGGIPLDEA